MHRCWFELGEVEDLDKVESSQCCPGHLSVEDDGVIYMVRVRSGKQRILTRDRINVGCIREFLNLVSHVVEKSLLCLCLISIRRLEDQ